MKALFGWAIRILVIAVCAFATVESIRWATADWLASSGRPEDFERATRIDPNDEEVLARSAIFRSNNGDLSPVVDDELHRAAGLNPRDSAVLIALGLREELRGNDAQAESWLTRAAAVDRQFKPAWALANYYYRANRPDKFWPMIERCLSLEPIRLRSHAGLRSGMERNRRFEKDTGPDSQDSARARDSI